MLLGLYAKPAGMTSVPEAPARRVSFSELLGSTQADLGLSVPSVSSE